MRVRGVFAGVLAVCGAVALSGPAHADQYDFITQLDNMGVSYESMLDMIDVGKEPCHDLRSGATPPVVLGKLQKTGFAPAEPNIDAEFGKAADYPKTADVAYKPADLATLLAEKLPCWRWAAFASVLVQRRAEV